jgi:hypothetical protein
VISAADHPIAQAGGMCLSVREGFQNAGSVGRAGRALAIVLV